MCEGWFQAHLQQWNQIKRWTTWVLTSIIFMGHKETQCGGKHLILTDWKQVELIQFHTCLSLVPAACRLLRPRSWWCWSVSVLDVWSEGCCAAVSLCCLCSVLSRRVTAAGRDELIFGPGSLSVCRSSGSRLLDPVFHQSGQWARSLMREQLLTLMEMIDSTQKVENHSVSQSSRKQVKELCVVCQLLSFVSWSFRLCDLQLW